MFEIEILKTYVHTARRTWLPGDRPTVTKELADRLIAEGIARLIGENDTRGITQEEMDEIVQAEKDKQEAEAARKAAEEKKKPKLILPGSKG